MNGRDGVLIFNQEPDLRHRAGFLVSGFEGDDRDDVGRLKEDISVVFHGVRCGVWGVGCATQHQRTPNRKH